MIGFFQQAQHVDGDGLPWKKFGRSGRLQGGAQLIRQGFLRIFLA
jgi:hypothetical protein